MSNSSIMVIDGEKYVEVKAVVDVIESYVRQYDALYKMYGETERDGFKYLFVNRVLGDIINHLPDPYD